MNVTLSQHAKQRLSERFNIKTTQDSIKIPNLEPLHGDKYLFQDNVLVIRNNVLITIYPRY